jgi:YggT family protein
VELICLLLFLYILVIFARIAMSWFPLAPGGAAEGINNFLTVLTDPVLLPFRNLIPPIRAGGVAIDVSAIVLIIGIQILRAIIC